MTDTNHQIAEREKFLFKSFEQLKLNDYLNDKDDSCMNPLKFTCSTPIKFSLNEQLTNQQQHQNLKQKEEQLELDHKSEFFNMNENHSIILNRSAAESSPQKKSSTDYLFEKCNGMKLNETADELNRFMDSTFKQNSLMEFEQNEKLAQANASNVYASASPVVQLESLLSNLRSKDEIKDKIVKSGEINPSEITSATVAINSLHVHSTAANTQPNGYFRKNDQLIALENRLENEIFRRQHCEKQIHELNENILELQQQLAVAQGLDRKKETIIQNMEISVQKVLESWKQKESVFDTNLGKAKAEKENLLINETRFKMKIQLLEQELKKVGDDLVQEKVKSQEYYNEVISLKSSLDELKHNKNSICEELKFKNEELARLREEASSLNVKLIELDNDLQSLNKEKKERETKLTSEIDALENLNKSLNEKSNEMKLNYEALIKEAKNVINESEKQYNLLAKEIEAEKLNKDSLQVEINMLEEKLSDTVKMLTNEYENKIHKMQAVSIEKEKQMKENHKSELDQVQSKYKNEFERFKSKNFDETQEKLQDYENKLTDMSLQIDAQRNENDRLKRVNNDLENDRNTIRQSLKQMLELQMKEAMQLLGLSYESNNNNSNNNNNNNTNNNSNISSSANMNSSTNVTSSTSYLSNKSQNTKIIPCFSAKPSSPAPVPPTPLLSHFNYAPPSPPSTKDFETSINDIINKFQINAMCKSNSSNKNNHTNSPIIHMSETIKNTKASSLSSASVSSASSSSKSSSVSDLISPSFKTIQQQPLVISSNGLNNSNSSMPIKDSFILNQIDLINQYYHIDNKTLMSNKSAKTCSLLDYKDKELPSVAEKSLFSSASAIGLTGQASLSVNSMTNHTTTNNNVHKGSILNLSNASASHHFYKSHENLANKADLTENKSTHPARGTELRHYIEILLNRSPTSPSNQSITTCASLQPAKTDFSSTIMNSINENSLIAKKKTTSQMMRSVSSQNISMAMPDFNRISLPFTTKHTENSLTLAPKKSDFNYFISDECTDIDDTFNDANGKASLNDESHTNGYKNKSSLFQMSLVNNNNNNYEYEENEYDSKKTKYHDVSDMEDTGYMKRESAEYYDDVKRTLNFDDDEDDDDNDDEDDNENGEEEQAEGETTPRKVNSNKFKFIHSTSTPTLLKEGNKLSLLTEDSEIQNLKKSNNILKKTAALVSKSQPNSLKKSSNNSVSTSQLSSHQQQSSSNTAGGKKMSVKKLKSIKKSNNSNNLNNISNISSRSLSMISLGQQTATGSTSLEKSKAGKPIWK